MHLKLKEILTAQPCANFARTVYQVIIYTALI